MKQQISRHGPVKGEWWIFEDGYEIASMPLQSIDWKEGRNGAEPSEDMAEANRQPSWLIVKKAREGKPIVTYMGSTYDPMAVESLHRRFANLHVSHESACDFANEFGFLGRSPKELGPPRVEASGESDRTYLGESLDEWISEIVKLQILVQIWDLYKDSSTEAAAKLESLLEIDDDVVSVRYTWLLDLMESFSAFREPYTLLSILGHGLYDGSDDEIIETYIAEIPSIINGPMRTRMAARLLVQNMVNSQLRLGSYGSVEAKDGSQVFLVPRDLLGAIYIHFAQELVGASIPAKQCPACGSYFIPEHGKQKYCDERCKFKGYRQRKKEAASG